MPEIYCFFWHQSWFCKDCLGQQQSNLAHFCLHVQNKKLIDTKKFFFICLVDNKELAKSHKILRKRLKKQKQSYPEITVFSFVTKAKGSVSNQDRRPLLGIGCSYTIYSKFSPQGLSVGLPLLSSVEIPPNQPKDWMYNLWFFEDPLVCRRATSLRKWVIHQQVSYPSANICTFISKATFVQPCGFRWFLQKSLAGDSLESELIMFFAQCIKIWA